MPTLQELLNVQNQQLDEINSLLNEEFLILKNKKAMALPEIEQKKAAVIDKIQKLDKVISEHPDCQLLKTTFKEQKDQILEKLKNCHRQNAVNGKLIQLCMASNRRLGSTLSKLKDRSSVTYDDKGSTHSISSGGIEISC
jgi:flagella synthesis protein FlgN